VKTKNLKKKGSLANGSQMTEEEDMKKLVEMKDKARKAETLKTARELLKGDKENLSKLGKHKLMAFYDKRFDKENDGKGCVMLVFGDTLNMGFKDSIIVCSYANVMAKDAKYAVDTQTGTLFRLDGKPVTLEDGKLMAKAYDEYAKAMKASRSISKARTR